jgi:surface polysaccharide O-acyltransferase-like enzyme
MNEKAQRQEKVIRWVCALLLTLAAALLGFILVGLCLREAHYHKPGDNDLVFCAVLAIIAALAFFSGYGSWSLWRGCVSSN